MEAIFGLVATFASPVLVNALVDLAKRYALSSLVSVSLVRTIVLFLSLVSAVLTLLIGGAADVDMLTNLVNTLLLTFFNFLAATGIFHLRK